MITFLSISSEIALRWTPKDITDDYINKTLPEPMLTKFHDALWHH